MKNKLYIASILTFTLIGCGGTIDGACCFDGTGIGKGEVLTQNQKIVTDIDGNTQSSVVLKDGDGQQILKVDFTNAKDSTNPDQSACPENDPCEIQVVQTSACDTNLNLSDCALNAAKAKAPEYNSLEKMVVFGGTIEVSEVNSKIDSCGMSVVINIPKCGKELVTGGAAGLNEGFLMKVWITATNASGCPVGRWAEARVIDGKIVLNDLTGITLPATFTLFTIVNRSDRFSGATGSGGDSI